MSEAPPRLSVILVSRTGLAEATPVLTTLRRQTVADAMEVLLVAPRGTVDPEALARFGFPWSRLVEVEEVDNRGRGAAAAMAVAAAPVVATVENHAFPEPDLFERVMEAWRDSDAALAPVIRPANRSSARSLGSFVLFYGDMAAPGHDGPRDSLPVHNGVYRSEVLRALGDDLGDAMAEEQRLHARLRARGHTLRQVPGAVTWHVNETRWRRLLGDPFILARRYGAHRCREWSVSRRLLYVAAVPAIAVARFRHLTARARAAEDVRAHGGRILPMLALLAVVSAAGEAAGYLDRGYRVPADFEIHEFHIRGRLAAGPPADPDVAALVAALPPEVP